MNDRDHMDPVLLLHCSASSGRQWDGLRQVLAGRFHGVAPDLHGYGASASWSGPGPLTLSAEAALAESFLVDDLADDARPLHVVGHSYGGTVALRYALEHAPRVRSLTLIEPVAFHLLRGSHAADQRLLAGVYKVVWGVIEGVLNGDYHSAMARFVDYWNGDGAWADTAPETRRRLSRHAPKIVLDFHAAMSEKTSLDAYRRCFTFPVRVIRGEHSPEPVRRIAELLSERLCGAAPMTVRGAGHMLPLTHAGEVNAAVMEHLDSGLVHPRRAA